MPYVCACLIFPTLTSNLGANKSTPALCLCCGLSSVIPSGAFALQHQASGLCAQQQTDSGLWEPLPFAAPFLTLAYGCQTASPSSDQSFTLASNGQLRHPATDKCVLPFWDVNTNGVLDPDEEANSIILCKQLGFCPLILDSCDRFGNSTMGAWEFTGCGPYLRHRASGMCVHPRTQPAVPGSVLTLIPGCNLEAIAIAPVQPTHSESY